MLSILGILMEKSSIRCKLKFYADFLKISISKGDFENHSNRMSTSQRLDGQKVSWGTCVRDLSTPGKQLSLLWLNFSVSKDS